MPEDRAELNAGGQQCENCGRTPAGLARWLKDEGQTEKHLCEPCYEMLCEGMSTFAVYDLELEV